MAITTRDIITVSRRQTMIRARLVRITVSWSLLRKVSRPIAEGVENASISWLDAMANHAESTSGQRAF
jgi:hypothetical protein